MNNDPIQAYRDAVAQFKAASEKLKHAEDAYNDAIANRHSANTELHNATGAMHAHILSTPATQPE